LVFSIVLILGYAIGINFIIDLVNYLILGSTAENSNKPMTLTFLGAIIVGNTAILTLTVNFKRAAQVQRQIELTEEAAISSTFKDAITLLGSENTSVRMGGIYTLVDMIKRCPEYREKIHNILCQHIVYRSNVEYYDHLKTYGVSTEEARIFENISLLRTFYLLEKHDFKNDSNLYSDIIYHKNFNNRNTLTKKTEKRGIYKEKLKEIDYENLIKLYDRYNNVILKCLDGFKSSDTIQEMINLVAINNPNSYIVNLCNAKIFNKDFTHEEAIIKNILLNNAFLYKSKIITKSVHNFQFLDTVIYKSQISYLEVDGLVIDSSIVRECTFINHSLNNWQFKGSSIIVGTTLSQPDGIHNPVRFDAIHNETNYVYIKGDYTQKSIIHHTENKKYPNHLNTYFKMNDGNKNSDNKNSNSQTEENNTYSYANYINKDEDFETAYEAYVSELHQKFEEVKNGLVLR